MRSLLLAAVVAAAAGCALDAAKSGTRDPCARGPLSAAELWKPLGFLESRGGDGTPRGHGTVAMLSGLLVVPVGVDGGRPGGALEVYDLRNPRCPELVARVAEPTLREAHGFAFHPTPGGMTAVFQSVDGIQFWSLDDPRRPRLLRRLVLPGIAANDYDLGAWWVTWQAPYLYVAGSGNGLYVVHAPTIDEARLVARFDPSELGGFRVGQAFALGNLLVLAANDQPGLATLDISDPTRPALLAATRLNPAPYASLLAGDRLLTAGQDGALHVFDLSDPRRLRFVGSSPVARGNGKGGYLSQQDGFAFAGFSSQIAKIELATLRTVATASSRRGGRDEDFATVVGNLVIAGDDHGVGSAIFAHQVAPDRTPPAILATSPKDGATQQRLTSRVGVAFGDALDPSSVGPANLVVRPIGGAPLPGQYSVQGAIAGFAPDGGFAPSTTYEIVVRAGGVRDASGNGVAATFVARWATGPRVDAPLACALEPTAPVAPGIAAGFAIAVSGGVPGAHRVSWQFGDGRSATGAGVTATHAYETAGHHTVIATVRSGTQLASCARTQTVHAPLTAGQPTASSSILHDGATDLAWVVNPDDDSVSAIDGEHRRRFEIPVGATPRTLARAPDGSIWVVNQASATLSVLDGATGEARASVPLPPRSRPFGVAFAPDGRAAFVTTQGTGELLRLDPATRALTGRVALGAPLRHLAITGDGRRVLVARWLSAPDGGTLYDVDADSLAVRPIRLARDPGPDGEAAGRGVPNLPGALAISPDGSHALVPSVKDNLERGLLRDGRPLTFESTVRTIVSRVELGGPAAADTLARRVDLNDRDLAQAVAFSRHGDLVAVAVQGSNAVEILDAYTGRTLAALPDVGRAPRGLALSATGDRLFVDEYLSRRVSVYDVRGWGDASRLVAPRLAAVATVERERLAPEILRGKQLFNDASDRRMNRDGYLSCASCHPDGESDGMTWDFSDQGEGLRNTITLLGRGGTRQGRVHWTANFDEIQDFEVPIRRLFGGRGFIAGAGPSPPLGAPNAGRDADLDALAAYVASLDAVSPSPHRARDGRGAELFGRLGCARCHAGAELTDSPAGATHDVGTSDGRPLDVPTLKGVWETAPYLHDGSAPTLREAIARHRPAPRATAAELDALVDYLATLDDQDTASRRP